MRKYKLSGERDHDQFLDSGDLGEHFDILMSCYHQGDCEADVIEAAKHFEIENIQAAREYLKEFDFSSLEIECDLDVTRYYLWMLAGDIYEMEQTPSIEVQS